MVINFVFVLNKSKVALRPNCSDDPEEVLTLTRDRRKGVLDTQRHHFIVNDQLNNTYSFSKIIIKIWSGHLSNADQQPNFNSAL